MNLSRRETIQSATAIAALSVAAIRATPAAAQAAAAAPEVLAETRLRTIAALPLQADGSAVEYSQSEAGPIDGVLWKTKGTPDIEFDYRKMKVKVDGRGTSKLSGTLTFADLEKLPPRSQITLLQCGAVKPHGIVKWTGVRFSDFAAAMGAQSFANYARFTASDDYYLDEDMKTLMHPQVMLAWLANDAPLPPQNGAPLRLVVPFRYGARSVKAITSIQFTATSFPPQKGWAA
ncbi:MAG TPA: molybdopterin-dependent oxidoreductase [Micropepsaceae bacterium]|jgi:DMSO/TMAO reductase YedYZ molybdopterin-dependent catalytic subunit|nr:molybdopterin-dependent oxidoreductase [Micropepsaceae bacterium]